MATKSPTQPKTSPAISNADQLTTTYDRNAVRFGWTPQAEIWNSRFAMLGFTAYLLWDFAGYSVARDILQLTGNAQAIPSSLVLAVVVLLGALGFIIPSMTPNAETAVDPLDPAHSRNAWILGWNCQQELWNGRFAMIGFVAYLLWDLAGYSVVRDLLHLA
ncbi:chlorophyll a/b-binding protein [Leptolyngbya sp. FACHB-261]|uniref:chlorophyll a/b-binding protein n=1 Tax=Leptolyngbya sp. FACHB-261 TaxID=2692806 RepID=UPI00168432D0|nr:chlorophyll a/b-binding protein [Leptolyngbya sp. FACHB-261]MBD2100583.1 hypothetical protein [Leptolyngbya sp. FACHB-261]